jgi:heme exporter protein C
MRIARWIPPTSTIILGVLVPLLAYALYLIFVGSPIEAQMGAVQKIFYFHVAAATACYLGTAALLAASLWWLATRAPEADALNEAGAEIGGIFCAIVLISGMIWGHSAWNTWFRWEPRLVSHLILLLVFLSLRLLRLWGAPDQTPAHAAVLGILAALTVPLVIFSIKLFPGVAQLHPVVIERGGLAPEFHAPLWISTIALGLFSLLLLALRFRIGLLERREPHAP